MNPDLLLSIAAALAGFALKTMAAFAVCLGLSQLVHSASYRFMLWSGLVYGSTAYWLFLASRLLLSARVRSGALRAPQQPAIGGIGRWQIPTAWALPAGLAARLIAIAYLLVLGCLIVSYLRKRLHLRWVLNFSHQPPPEIAEVFQTLAQRMHVSRSRIVVLSGATSPATFGWMRPTVLLPSVCLEQDGADLEDILCHELQHVRRWDSFWNGLAMACRALLFFHPAAWYAVKKMQFNRELACDLAVISQAPARRGNYAECLIRFARLNTAPDSTNWGIDFAASAEQLTIRVHTILAASKRVPGWLLGLRAICGLCLLFLLIGLLPSLAVLLSFARQPVMPAPAATMQTAAPGTRKDVRRSGKTRSFSRTIAGTPAAGEIANSIAPAMEPPPDGRMASSLPLASGPQLQHRAAGTSAPIRKSASVSLSDGDVSGKDQPDRKQAVQQSATAALGLYRRLGDLDRR